MGAHGAVNDVLVERSDAGRLQSVWLNQPKETQVNNPVERALIVGATTLLLVSRTGPTLLMVVLPVVRNHRLSTPVEN